MSLETGNGNSLINNRGTDLQKDQRELGLEVDKAVNVRAILSDIQYYAELVGFDFSELGTRLRPLVEAMSKHMPDTLYKQGLTLIIELFFADKKNLGVINDVLDINSPELLNVAKLFIETFFQKVVFNPKVQEEAKNKAAC